MCFFYSWNILHIFHRAFASYRARPLVEEGVVRNSEVDQVKKSKQIPDSGEDDASRLMDRFRVSAQTFAPRYGNQASREIRFREGTPENRYQTLDLKPFRYWANDEAMSNEVSL